MPPTASEVLFVSLDPDESLSGVIQSYKNCTRELAGEQLFLADPPHLTVYLANFADAKQVASECAALAQRLPRLPANIEDWHVFAADAMTGNNTLVCQIAADDRERMRSLQDQVIRRLAPLRDVAATDARLSSRFNALRPEEQTNARNCGFPYLGPGWHPHFTIASIRTADWPRIWPHLELTPPVGRFLCPQLTLYRVTNGHCTPLESFAFGGTTP